VCWNGANTEAVRALAGEDFIGVHGEHVLIRGTDDSTACWVRPGWWIVCWDGESPLQVFGADSFAGDVEIGPGGIARTRVRRGSAELWDGTNIDAIRAVAGSDFAGMHSEYVLIHGADSEVKWVRPGWWVARWDGTDHVRVYHPGSFTSHCEAEPEEVAAVT